MTRRLNRGKRALFALVPVTCILLAVEVVCRVATPAPEKQVHYLEPDPELLWRLKPLAGGPQATNALGLRDTTYRADADVKVLLLGDSVSYGDGEPDLLRCYPQVLERLLAKRDPQRTWEVINSGVPGYATFQELRYLKLRGLDLEPDAVVLQFCLNDLIEPGLHVAAYGGGSEFLGIDTRGSVRGLHGWLLQHSRAYERVARAGQDQARREETYKVERLCEDPLPAELEAAWRQTEADLEAIHGLCRERKLPLLIVVAPYAFQVADPAQRQPQARLQAWAKERGVPCVDLIPPLEAAARQDPKDLFYDPSHFGPRGQEVAAQALLQPVLDLVKDHGG